jgi:heme/copper-type cytochrome/quinol oxidase subunit 4
MIVVVVAFLTIIIHMVYFRVIRHGIPHTNTNKAVGAWMVCFVIALVICGALM